MSSYRSYVSEAENIIRLFVRYMFAFTNYQLEKLRKQMQSDEDGVNDSCAYTFICSEEKRKRKQIFSKRKTFLKMNLFRSK